MFVHLGFAAALMSAVLAVVLCCTVDWLREMCGFPEGGGGLFTSGGSTANFTAIAAARHTLAADGTLGCTVYYCDQTHDSNERALRLVGFTEGQMRVVPSGDDYAMDVAALTRMVREDADAGRRPLLVVATAGTTNVGAVDDMSTIADVCRKHGMWFHVDGAYGAAAMISPELRPRLAGIERADSLSVDPHKWMFQPFEIGCVLVKDTTRLRDTFQIMPDYLKDVHALGEINFTDYGMQLTRGFRALKLWMSLQYFGAKRFRDAVEYGVALAERTEEILQARDGWEVITPATLGILSFRYVPSGVSDEDANRINDGIVAGLIDDGFAMLSSTVLGDRTALRVCTINPATTEDDIVATIDKLEEIGARLVA